MLDSSFPPPSPQYYSIHPSIHPSVHISSSFCSFALLLFSIYYLPSLPSSIFLPPSSILHSLNSTPSSTRISNSIFSTGSCVVLQMNQYINRLSGARSPSSIEILSCSIYWTSLFRSFFDWLNQEPFFSIFFTTRLPYFYLKENLLSQH